MLEYLFLFKGFERIVKIDGEVNWLGFLGARFPLERHEECMYLVKGNVNL